MQLASPATASFSCELEGGFAIAQSKVVFCFAKKKVLQPVLSWLFWVKAQPTQQLQMPATARHEWTNEPAPLELANYFVISRMSAKCGYARLRSTTSSWTILVGNENSAPSRCARNGRSCSQLSGQAVCQLASDSAS